MVLLEGSVGWCYWKGQLGGAIVGVSWIVYWKGQLDGASGFIRMVLGDGPFRWYYVMSQLGSVGWYHGMDRWDDTMGRVSWILESVGWGFGKGQYK